MLPGRRFAHSEKTLNKYKNALYSQFCHSHQPQSQPKAIVIVISREGEIRTPDSVPDYSAFAPFICRFPPHAAVVSKMEITTVPPQRSQASKIVPGDLHLFVIAKFSIVPSDSSPITGNIRTFEVVPRSGVEPPFYRHHSNAAALEKVRVLFPLKSSV